MKKLCFILTITVLVFSCTKDYEIQNVVNPDFIGKWKLVETYNDPGDGSGVYESIDSDKTIEFFNDGTFTITGPLCNLSTSVGEKIIGKVRNSIHSNNFRLISNEECSFDNSSIDNSSYQYIASIVNSDLRIYYTACIEGCAHKYQKINAE